MQKAMILVALVALAGCQMPTYSTEEIPHLGLDTVEEVMQWVAQNVRYVGDSTVHGRPDEWQLPHQTYIWRSGDCEDFAILAVHLLRVEIGVEATVELGNDGQYGHAWVRVNGEHWEPQTAEVRNVLPIQYSNGRMSYHYNEAMGIAHQRSVQ